MKKLLIALLSICMMATVSVAATGCFGGGSDGSSSSVEMPEVYTVTFDTNGGDAIAAQEVTDGEKATKPNDPEKTGHTFAGWKNGTADWSFDTPITENITLTAVWTVNEYTITFVVDGEETTQSVEYGETPAFSGTPEKDATAEYTYTFSGWTPAIVAVTGEATYTAQFTETKRSYEITFVVDGKETTQSVEYGETPAFSGTPEKDATAEYTYTFSCWNPSIVAVTGEATYTAQFTETKRSYTVTFVDFDGEVLHSETVEYGVTPTAPADPTRDATAQFTYAFAGWDKTVVAVTGEATYTATYTETLNEYTITFADEDGTTLQSGKVAYGTLPVAPADPEKADTAEWDYTFDGWTPAIAEVTGEATYTATYKQEKQTYTVKFNSNGGSAVAEQTVEYGATIERPADPTWENGDEEFIGWFVDGVEWDFETTITGDVELKAAWKGSEVDDNWNDKDELA